MAADDDERVVFETRLHPASLVGALTFAACVAGATALLVYRNPLEPGTVVRLWLAALAIIAIAAAAPLARWWSSRFAVTTQRLTVRSGALRRRRLEVPLGQLVEITVAPGLLGRLLGYGTVRILAAGEQPEVFTRVAAPDALRNAALRQPRSPRRRTTS